jgi:hypothetical protein
MNDMGTVLGDGFYVLIANRGHVDALSPGAKEANASQQVDGAFARGLDVRQDFSGCFVKVNLDDGVQLIGEHGGLRQQAFVDRIG